MRLALRRLLHPAALLTLLTYTALLALGWWAFRHLTPDTLALRVAGHSLEIGDLHRRLGDRIVGLGLLLPAVFFVEYLWTGWRDSSSRQILLERSASMRSDIVCYVLALAPGWTVLCGLMTFGVALVSGAGLRNLLADKAGLDLDFSALPLLIQSMVLFILYTFFDYWSHRLDHSRLFWPLHRFHHAAESFSVLTAARIHPAAFTGIIIALPIALFRFSPWAAIDVGLVVAAIRCVIHSRIQSDFGWIGRWIVCSPLHHSLHHSLNRMPINLGLVPIWDRLFGTWRQAPKTAMKIGTVKPYRHGAWVGPDIWRDYQEFLAGLAALLSKPGPTRKTAKAPRLASPTR